MGTGTVKVPVPGIFHFSDSIGTGIRKIWYRKKYRYRYRKYLVPEKSIGIGIVQHFGYRHTLHPSLNSANSFTSLTIVTCRSIPIFQDALDCLSNTQVRKPGEAGPKAISDQTLCLICLLLSGSFKAGWKTNQMD